MGSSSLTRDWTQAPCIGILHCLSHWTTREVPKIHTLEKVPGVPASFPSNMHIHLTYKGPKVVIQAGRKASNKSHSVDEFLPWAQRCLTFHSNSFSLKLYVLILCSYKCYSEEKSLAIQCLRTWHFPCQGLGLTPGWGTKILHAARHSFDGKSAILWTEEDQRIFSQNIYGEKHPGGEWGN